MSGELTKTVQSVGLHRFCISVFFIIFAAMNESKRLPRVLVVNKFYYRRGGDCVYTLNLEHMLRSAGHEVAVFAMRYPLNESADWEDYFPTEVSFSGSLTQKLRAVRRMLGSDDVASCFTALLNDFRPEIVHLNNIHSYLSPALASIAHALSLIHISEPTRRS